jgi:hypothetical protein
MIDQKGEISNRDFHRVLDMYLDNKFSLVYSVSSGGSWHFDFSHDSQTQPARLAGPKKFLFCPAIYG